jgi:AraC-like DNA-binding protein
MEFNAMAHASVTFLQAFLVVRGLNSVVGQPAPHAFHELVYAMDGQYDMVVAGERCHGEAGDVFLYPEGTLHHSVVRSAPPTSLYVLQWRGDLGVTMTTPFARVGDVRGRLRCLLQWLCEINDDPAAADERTRVLQVVLDEYARLTRGDSGRLDPVEVVQQMLHRTFQERSITLDKLAKTAGVSVGHLCRTFRARTGVSPLQYLQRIRVDAALALLCGSDHSLGAIAHQVGLCDQPHLSRLIRAHTGRTARAIRAETRSAGGQAALGGLADHVVWAPSRKMPFATTRRGGRACGAPARGCSRADSCHLPTGA